MPIQPPENAGSPKPNHPEAQHQKAENNFSSKLNRCFDKRSVSIDGNKVFAEGLLVFDGDVEEED